MGEVQIQPITSYNFCVSKIGQTQRMLLTTCKLKPVNRGHRFTSSQSRYGIHPSQARVNKEKDLANSVHINTHQNI